MKPESAPCKTGNKPKNSEAHQETASGSESKFFSSGCYITVGNGRKTNGLMPINKGYC